MSDNLSKSNTGAWLLHHDQKLQTVQTTEFEAISTAGRSARLLSVISREVNWSVSMPRVEELARGIGIRKLELPGLINELVAQGLVEASSKGVSVLGVTQASLVSHAADIFVAQGPSGLDWAAIDLAERASFSPVRQNDVAEELSDTYRLSRQQTEELFSQSEQISFVDYEGQGEDRLYFNGALFKREGAAKAKRVLESLDAEEQGRLATAEGILACQGCVLANKLQKILGPKLWSKLHQIGFYEVNVIRNELGATEFVTKPASLQKFSPGGLPDMLDDAKALATSFAYGIVKSNSIRGQIREPDRLINAFIGRGYVEGRARALGEDYKILERRGVVQVQSTPRGLRLNLLKEEVGEMARELILHGDAAATAVEVFSGKEAVKYQGPEASRSIERRPQVSELSSSISKSLNVLRKL